MSGKRDYDVYDPPSLQTKYKFLESEDKVEHHFPKSGRCGCGFVYANDESAWSEHLTEILFPKKR